MLPFAAALLAFSPYPNCANLPRTLGPLCEGSGYESSLASHAPVLRRYDIAGDGLDAGDVELVRQQGQARSRASAWSRLLRFDLNGDFTLDRAEIARADEEYRDGARDAGRRMSALFAMYDTDGDGLIAREEVQSVGATGGGDVADRLGAVLARDPDGDGRLSAAEFAGLLRADFEAVDLDRDNVVSADELQAAARRARDAELAPRRAAAQTEAATRRAAIAADICVNGGRPPIPVSFGSHGVQAQYSFVTQGARRQHLRAFLRLASDRGFSFLPVTINLAGVDTLIVPGRGALADAGQVEREFQAACQLRTGGIYLGHVRHNLTTEQTREQVRVR